MLHFLQRESKSDIDLLLKIYAIRQSVVVIEVPVLVSAVLELLEIV